MILGVIDEQLKEDNPKEVRITFCRLVEDGYTEEEAKEKIAHVLIVELYDVLKYCIPFNEERYVSELKKIK